MNKAVLLGRTTKDPEIRYSQGSKPTAVARFTLAVDRRFKRDGEPTADFISCIAFGKTAEVIEKYVKQGTKIGVVGSIQTGSYTNKEGQKVYTTDIIVDEIDFAESKSGGNSQGNSRPEPNKANGDGFMNIPSDIDSDELPFA
jgi:single-strand DNA-binding protein